MNTLSLFSCLFSPSPCMIGLSPASWQLFRNPTRSGSSDTAGDETTQPYLLNHYKHIDCHTDRLVIAPSPIISIPILIDCVVLTNVEQIIRSQWHTAITTSSSGPACNPTQNRVPPMANWVWNNSHSKHSNWHNFSDSHFKALLFELNFVRVDVKSYWFTHWLLLYTRHIHVYV